MTKPETLGPDTSSAVEQAGTLVSLYFNCTPPGRSLEFEVESGITNITAM